MKIYRSNYGLPLGRWDRFMNWLWYQEDRNWWGYISYHLLHPLEKIYWKLTENEEK